MATPIPGNRAAFTPDDVARFAAGAVRRSGLSSLGVSTDTRTVTKGSLFVALAGERFDGHDFLCAAVEAGAVMLLVERNPDLAMIDASARRIGATPPGVVKVENTRVALGRLASAHRQRWSQADHLGGPRTVLGITGSAGKTTTKIVTAKLMEAAVPGQVLWTHGNLNNDIGVPMTLLGLEPEHRFAVLEMGTSRRGEIEQLARIALPQAAVLTLIARAHSAGIGSIDEVAMEKGDLLRLLPPAGVAIVNGDDPRAVGQLGRTPARSHLTYGFVEGAHYRIVSYGSRGAHGTEATIARPAGPLELTLPLLGRSGALAAAAGLAASETLLGRPLSREEAEFGLAGLSKGIEGRLKLLHLDDGTIVIDDSYNANPASMRSSISAAAEIARHEKRRLVLVLGEMRELGEASESEHDALGRFVGGSDAGLLIGIAGHANAVVGAARALHKVAEFSEDLDGAAALLESGRRPGDVILVKGSRSVATDRLIGKLLGGAKGEVGLAELAKPGGALGRS